MNLFVLVTVRLASTSHLILFESVAVACDVPPYPFLELLQSHLRLNSASAQWAAAFHPPGAPYEVSHSGLLEPRGTSTVRKEPGVLDKTTWSVMP